MIGDIVFATMVVLCCMFWAVAVPAALAGLWLWGIGVDIDG